MQKKIYRFWLILLILSAGIMAYFSGVTLKKCWDYYRYSEKVLAQVFNWDIVEISSSYFALEAKYRYFTNGNVYEGKTVFDSPRFLNRFSAEHEIRSFKNKKWHAWHIKNKPTYSSLKREFPLKSCFNACLTFGVFVYFYFAKGLISKFSY